VTMVAEVRGCQGCGACLLTCPEHAIRPARGRGSEAGTDGGADAGAVHLSVRGDLCTGCGECVEVCPVDAIVLEARA
jgi:NAD-dependent dihydropyrimidine dehydrogenase PreA subunit